MSISLDKYHVKIVLDDPILGTVSKDKKVYSSYVLKKAIEKAKKEGIELTEKMLESELNAVEHVEESGWTGFYVEDGKPFLSSHMIKGFFKEACKGLRRSSNTESGKFPAYIQVINQAVFIRPKKLFLSLNGGTPSIDERPLRASTPQGERIALARSDSCPAGTSTEFDVYILSGVKLKDTTMERLLFEWLQYGSLKGLGQWRNSGIRGAFDYEVKFEGVVPLSSLRL